MKPQHPLAEVFGFPATDMSASANRHRSKRLCPFNNKVPNCTKDKAQEPLGVCSVFHENEVVITCPIRFRQQWLIADDAAEFFFGTDAKWTTMTEVRLKDADGGSAGNIDVVLCAYDKAGKVYDFGALEVQAVYISGNVRNPFEHYMESPAKRSGMDWTTEANYPRPDYLSSSRKRLAPQLIFKGGIINAWGKKTAVALNKGFFNTLPKLPEVRKAEADIAWLIYDLKPPKNQGEHYELFRERTIYTRFEPALNQITKSRPGKMEDFKWRISCDSFKRKLTRSWKRRQRIEQSKTHSTGEMTQTFLLPELEIVERDKPVNVASVPQRSPFRYPGGKTWLVPLFRRWMFSMPTEPKLLVEPFAGGGIIGLTAAFEYLADEVLLVELDRQIAAVWKTMLGGDARWLAKRIIDFELNPETAKAELGKTARNDCELAFQTIIKNRTKHGGILADGAGVLKHGENGKGILSRWYPQTIAKRITNIELVASRLRFVQGNAFEVITEHRKNRDAVFFIDPPYTAGGKRAGSRLYTHSEIDHEHLFTLCESLRGDFLMTYDNADEVRALAEQHGFETKAVQMKNTHHAEMAELLIGRNLDWVEDGGIFREESSAYKVASVAKKHDTRNEPQGRGRIVQCLGMNPLWQATA